MNSILRLSLAHAAAAFLLAQMGTSPQFEVASVKPSAPGAPDQVSIGLHIDGARITCNYLSLLHYIRLAYQVKDYQIIGPEWVASERYDIAATLPAGADQKQVPDMIKALLTDRFHLKLHHALKEFPVYALVVGKNGLKITASPIDTEANASAQAVEVTGGGSRDGVSINLGHGAGYTFANNRFEAKKISLAQFADALARLCDRPVVDMTGIPGTYDISLTFSEEDYQGMLMRVALNAGINLPLSARQRMEAASGDSMAGAMQSAGLKLESRKAPLDVLMVDSVDRVPSAN